MLLEELLFGVPARRVFSEIFVDELVVSVVFIIILYLTFFVAASIRFSVLTVSTFVFLVINIILTGAEDPLAFDLFSIILYYSGFIYKWPPVHFLLEMHATNKILAWITIVYGLLPNDLISLDGQVWILVDFSKNLR